MKHLLRMIPFAVALAPVGALAHAHLVSSSPPDGGEIAADATSITLSFDALINQADCLLADAEGKSVAGLGEARLEREKVHLPLKGPLAEGRFVVTCKVKADRHEVSHSVSFVAKGPR